MEQGRESKLNLVFRVGTRLCALPVEHVAETMRPLPIQEVAGAPPFVLGLSVIRGTPVPVVHAARLLVGANAATGVEGPARFAVIKVRERRVALAVDAIVGVRSLASATVDDLPPLLRDAKSDAVAAIGLLDADLLVVLERSRIVPEETWDAMAAAGALS